MRKCHERWCAWLVFWGFWWFLFRGILQFIMFHWATMGCNASNLGDDYRYPGGSWTCAPTFDHSNVSSGTPSQWASVITTNSDDMDHCKYSPANNVVPSAELLVENPSSFMGQAFTVYPGNTAASVSQAQVGMWWRTWGPWFWTYTYQDLHQRTSLYMRPTLMGMMGLYSESRIMRCDGSDDVWFFGEGSDWISNRIRSFFGSIFGLQREGTFTVYRGNEHYGKAAEVFHGPSKSITFTRGEGATQFTLASSVLVPNHDQAEDMWSMSEAENTDTPFREQAPCYVMSAASVLMAFRWISLRHSAGVRAGHTTLNHAPPAPPPAFLAERSDASATFVEENEE